MSQFVTIVVEDEVVIGQITHRENFFIRIQIISPYTGWENGSTINGPGKSHYSFLTSYGDETVRRLLEESFLKIRCIDEDIDRLVRVYDNMLAEIKLVSSLPKTETRDRVISKIQDWFYDDCLFTSSVTGLIAAYAERPLIDKIITTYKKEKRKIYLPD